MMLNRTKQLFSDPILGTRILNSISLPIVYSSGRAVKTEISIERGFFSKDSIALILYELSLNNKGYLFSIYLPGHDMMFTKIFVAIIVLKFRLVMKQSGLSLNRLGLDGI